MLSPLMGMTILGLVGQSVAFPALAEEFAAKAGSPKDKRAGGVNPGFNAAAQRIDVSGAHAFVPPGQSDLRGPCPGLNALANHNYIPHNGVATIDQFVQATNQVYGMGLDLATFLSVYGAVMDGDLTSWSIGGPPPSSLVSSVAGLLGQPQGISGSHNKYETDGSPTRGDLYQYGNDYLVQMSQWQALYNQQASVADNKANYGLGVLTDFRVQRFQQCINQNPYYFYGPFSGALVQPAAYTFIYRFMGNKSAENPEGILNKQVLMSFFAITGKPGSFKYTPGWERIPENWYKRAIGDEYTIPFYSTDLNAAAVQHPQFLNIGGNTGKTNTFTPVDLSNLTGGVYNAKNLLQGNNLACFGYQTAVLAAPDILKGLYSNTGAALSKLNSALANAISGLGCPQLQKIDESQFKKYPGYTKLSTSGTY